MVAELRPGPPVRPDRVWIVMLTWNAIDYTRACLDALFGVTASETPWTVCVVDNGSRDGTVEYLRTRPVELIENPANAGFTRGVNQGIRAAPPGADILLLNNDLVIDQADWLDRLIDAAYSRPEIGLVGCRMVRPEDGRLVHAGAELPVDTYFGIEIGGGEIDVGQYQRRRRVEGVVAACLYIRRPVIDQIGLFDERFFAYFEDTDYCLRAARAGWDVLFAGDVTLQHHENVSTRVNRVDFRQLHRRSQEIFYDKWPPEMIAPRGREAVHWHSMMIRPFGYAQASRNLVLELDRQGVDVRLSFLYGVDNMEPVDDDPKIREFKQKPKDLSLPQVIYGQGDAFFKNAGRVKVGYTMLEVDGLPVDWVNQSNMMDEIWTPTRFNAEVFAGAGIRRPIRVMPLGVDLNHFHPTVRRHPIRDRCTFLSVFEWGRRKGPDVLLRAYARAFTRRDAVLLILKADNWDPTIDVAREIEALDLPPDHAPISVLLNHVYAPPLMASLYRSADCFVLPSRGEGWGLPVLESMACGVPSIATDWSGTGELLQPEWGYPLRSRGLVPAHDKCPYYEGFRWADPDVEHLAHLMRHVYEHPDEARAKGERAAEEAARWTWEASVRRIRDRLIEIT